MVSGPEFQTFSYERLALDLKADMALKVLYPQNPTLTTLLLWFPVAIAAIVAAVCVVLGYRYARQTWRGRARVGPKPSRIDSIIDSVIDLSSTLSEVLNRQNASKHVREISRKFGLEVDPDAVVEKLPVGLQQRVEIIKALYRKADILILDEPTAVLTPQEGRELFQIMKQLASQGVSIIFITHKLKEVFTVADSIVVMRGGKVVGATTPAEATESSLAAMMVGREVLLRVEKAPATPNEVVLSVEDLNAVDDRGAVALDSVSFEVRGGEVLGIAGVQGNGQTELVEALTGLRRTRSGRFRIAGQRLEHAGPRAITMIGTGHVPEDRQRYGMVLPFPVADNLVLNQYYNTPFATLPTVRTLPFSLAIYIAVFSAVFAGGVWLWTSSLWLSIQAGLSLAERDVRRDAWPFVLSLLLTLAAAFIGMGIAHLAGAGVITLLRRVLDIRPKQGSGGLTIDENAV
jgi:ABC-type multidrug transport system ATPase subunit